MALPYEGDTDFGRNGTYELTGDQSEEVRPLNVKQRPSVSVEDGGDNVSDDLEQQGCWERFQQCTDAFFTRICPSCLTSALPSCVIFLIALLIVLLVVASIPLVFVLTYSQPASLVTDGMPSREYVDLWPNEGDLRSDNFNDTLSIAMALPENVTDCTGFGFHCANRPDIVVGTNSRCDGIADCPDGSDEDGCKECQTSFSCPLYAGNGTFKACIHASFLCDTTRHCADGADEELCNRKCTPEEIQCGHKCLPKSLMCDGETHCADNEDEVDCKGKCSNGSKWCESSKSCISKTKLCNGIHDCQDGSDEMDCACTACSGQGKILCKSDDDPTKGTCILRHQICNGIPDCPGGTDEEGCLGHVDVKLPEDQMVTCQDGKKYSKVYACSGLIPSCAKACSQCDKDFAFDCGNNHCIARSKVCNGVADCPNGSDEEKCDSCSDDSVKCTSPSFNGKLKCIDKSLLCNGIHDCPGGEDENDCEKCSTTSNIYCKSEKRCLAPISRCDGRPECQDKSDEANCSPEECAIHPFAMYKCDGQKTCLRVGEVCKPLSLCPHPSRLDKLYCAARVSKFPWF